ncbi:MAG: phosphoenolpyruvate kinase, partial [Gemmatimonadetes bacterium]|nr:phosphoenolpyruvate kinase [Gemmatimonadota bacterium]
MNRYLDPAELEAAAARLRPANLAFAARYTGETAGRQPVHTVYQGAQHFRHDAAAEHGRLALAALREYAPTARDFAHALGIPADEALYARVVEKLEREPVEDFRVDFEDGYGYPPDDEEDDTALAVAGEMARGMEAGTLPAYVGLRLKALNEELRPRSIRTLDLFLTRLLQHTGGRLPEGFILTVPKVTIPEQVGALAGLFELFEPAAGLPGGALKMELMVETTQSIINHRGESALPLLVAAARGRCVAAHFGTYDYTASCQITAAHQHMTHPACDFARHVMQVALGGTGVWLSDG